MYADSLISLFVCFSGLNVLGFALYMPNILGLFCIFQILRDMNFSQDLLCLFSRFSLGSGSSTLCLLPLFEDISWMLNFSLAQLILFHHPIFLIFNFVHMLCISPNFRLLPVRL